MKTIFIFAITLSFSISNAQPQSLQDSTLFDFWVGHWSLTWTGADGKTEKGSNHIVKILDQKVIQENFEDSKDSFKGTSLTVYNPRKKSWHQAWADNQGGYFDFVGSVDGDKRIFSTQIKEVGSAMVIHRMVFHDIKTNTFTWDWQQSHDGGKSWTLQWRIYYERKEKI
jgi:hypothetical protein